MRNHTDRRRVRHQGQDAPSPRWSATRSRPPTSSSSTRTPRPSNEPRAPALSPSAAARQLRGAAAGQRSARERDHRRHQPRRRRCAGHPHRARVGAERQDHRRGPGGREPTPAGAVRRRLDRGDRRDGGPAAGHRRTDPERCGDDGGSADPGRAASRSPNARSRPRRSAARPGICPTSCSVWCAGDS